MSLWFQSSLGSYDIKTYQQFNNLTVKQLRLDYFLKLSRIVKRRPLAKEMCDKHLIKVNDQVAKAGKEVKAGDRVTVTFRNRVLEVRVEDTPERAISKKEASTLYAILEDLQVTEEEFLC